MPLVDHLHRFDSRNDDTGAPERLDSQHRSGDPLDGAVVLLDDVVDIFVLTHQHVDAGVGLDAFNGGRVGAARGWPEFCVNS